MEQVAKLGVGTVLAAGSFSRAAGQTSPLSMPVQAKSQLYNTIPPLFCTAYITPDAPGQENQEPLVARYPLALVPQDARPQYRRWRDKVRSLNPQIMLLGYQMVIEETTVPGPGHNVMRKVDNAWCEYPGGLTPWVHVAPSRKKFRIFDPRKSAWRAAFIEACTKTLESYPFDGLLLDQCTVFTIASPLPWVREEMMAALQETLLELRNTFPSKILIGNSGRPWRGLNGVMDENRPKDYAAEFTFPDYALPRMNLAQTRLSNAHDSETVRREMALAFKYGAFYGAAVDYQHVLWFDAFDEVLMKYKRA